MWGPGVVSWPFFAAQAGAAKVFAVEASDSAGAIRAMIDGNPSFQGVVEVINKVLEDVTPEEVPPNSVDVIVSEPFGQFLVYERGIDTMVTARDRFLKPGGRVYPSKAHLCLSPFHDPALHQETVEKADFWGSQSHNGVDLSAAHGHARHAMFSRPVIQYIDPKTLLAHPYCKVLDFEKMTPEENQRLRLDLDFFIHYPAVVHGLGGWFDLIFDGTDSKTILPTGPQAPGTHWYQIQFLLDTPLTTRGGESLRGSMQIEAAMLNCHHLSLDLALSGVDPERQSTVKHIDLGNPVYRCGDAKAYRPPVGHYYGGIRGGVAPAPPVPAIFPPLDPAVTGRVVEVGGVRHEVVDDPARVAQLAQVGSKLVFLAAYENGLLFRAPNDGDGLLHLAEGSEWRQKDTTVFSEMKANIATAQPCWTYWRKLAA
mmetsp:Transcript_102848/g.235900  ORF Transcript_102848/g.235900 Transcript_102848/m.235900 type:complete len:426 (-) Transcript_102848:45-1322(-)